MKVIIQIRSRLKIIVQDRSSSLTYCREYQQFDHGRDPLGRSVAKINRHKRN